MSRITEMQRDADALDLALFNAAEKLRAFNARYPGRIKLGASIGTLASISLMRHGSVRPLMDEKQRAATSGEPNNDEAANDAEASV